MSQTTGAATEPAFKNRKQRLDDVKKAASVAQLYNTKFDLYPFTGEWFESFGMVEKGKIWFIMAPVNSGKTTFVAMLCKYMSGFGRVAYNSIEEGISESLKKAFKRANITSKDKVVVLDKESLADLRKRLKKHRSADIVVIDTIQHSDIDKRTYLSLKNEFCKKTFIIISHMEGSKPEGRLAKFIHQDASVKVLIEAFKAYVSSRYGGGKPFVIWQEGADSYKPFQKK